MKMKAALLYGQRDIRIEKIDQPKASDGIDGKGVVLKIDTCGICSIKDMAYYKQGLPDYFTSGIAPGHEYCGEVVDIGPNVTGVKLGDRFYGYSYRPCLKCSACQAKNYGGCEDPYQGSCGTWINGAMAEYLLVPVISVERFIKIPDDISSQDGALLEPTILGIGLASKADAGDLVVVFGQDLMGLATVVCLKERGVAKVIAADVSQKRLQAAKEAGADIVVDELNEDIVKVVMKETAGAGADIVIEASQRPISFQQAIAVTQPTGKIWTTTEAWYAPYVLHPQIQAKRGHKPETNNKTRGFTIQNAWGTLGPTIPRLQHALDLYRSGKISAKKHVTHVFPLEKAKEAFEVALNPHKSIKVIVEPWSSK
jgi:threonine dehydrogenase-like Zn-dependent dehydrogenase